MRIIYVDENHVCHVEAEKSRIPVETDAFDYTADAAIECYKIYISSERNMIECFEAEKARMVQNQFDSDNEIMNIITGEVSINDES